MRSKGAALVALVCLVLIAGTALCYWPVGQFSFVSYDDPLYVNNNSVVRRGLTWLGTAWAFRTFDGGNWCPLVWLSHMADCQVYGLKAGGHHWTNVILHATNSVGLFFVWRNLTGALWRSALVAALFAWHPMHVESVAWISERKDVLSGLFWVALMGTYAIYARAAKPRRAVWYVATLFFFTLGLMSKPMLVTLPLVLLLLDGWPLQRPEKFTRLVVEKIPFLILSGAASFVAVIAQRHVGAMAQLPLGFRLGNALIGYFSYIEKFIWPVDLACLYPLPHSIATGAAVGAAILLTIISAWTIVQWNTRRYLAVGWLWFLGTLVPVIGLVQVGTQSTADRYSYIPYIGLAVMLSWGLGEVCLRWPKVRGAIIGLAAFALIGAGVATGHQVKYWRNSRALYEHTLAVTADNSVILENLGIEMGVENDAAQSVQLLQDALKLSPDRGSIFYNLGKAYSMEHRLTDALAADEMAVQLRPGDPKSLNNLAWIYAASPQPELRNGAKAVALAEKACQLTQRQDPEILDTLAAALAETGRFTDAIQTTIEMQNLARAEHDDAIASLAESRLRAYRAGQALHEE